MLTKEDILKAKDIRTKVLSIPEWGGDITVKFLSLKDFSQIESASKDVFGKIDTLKLAVATFVAGVADPVFEPKDVEELQKKNVAVLSDVVREINKISGKETDQKNG